MNKRPLSITILGWLFIITGGVGLLYHVTEIDLQHPFPAHQAPFEWAFGICFVRLLAVIGGLFLLKGFNWARWLLVAWMAFHIVISAMHSLSELLVHSLLFVVILCFLFRPRSSAYFGVGAEARRSDSGPNNEGGDNLQR
jgi:hypothetical protein